MAAQTLFTLEEEELYCPICFEEYNFSELNRQPKLLLCLHTFCLECMKNLLKYDGTLECSICRTSHHVNKTCELMDNYSIFEYLRKKQETEDEKLAERLLKQEHEEFMKAFKEQVKKIKENEKHEKENERLILEIKRRKIEETSNSEI